MNDTQRRSMDFGRKEHVLNYACQTYQLSRPTKVGAVMALIRECQPACFDERMKQSFHKFSEEYGGKVFVVCSVKGEIANPEVISEIRKEVERLQQIG